MNHLLMNIYYSMDTLCIILLGILFVQQQLVCIRHLFLC